MKYLKLTLILISSVLVLAFTFKATFSGKPNALEIKGYIFHNETKIENATVKLYQDVSIFISELEKGKSLEFSINEKRQVYFVQIEGVSNVNGVLLDNGDAMEVTQEVSLDIKALENSHFIFIEMPES